MRKLMLLTILVSFSLQAQNLTVSAGKSFTVEKTGSVKIAGNLTNNGTFTLNSDADEFSSVIVDYDDNGSGSSTGNIDYNRYVNTVGSDEWDLIGSPLDAVSISTFVSANTTSSPATLAQNGSAYALSLIHISEPTRRTPISYAVFCLKKSESRSWGSALV